jgi:hypothetical protein
MYHAGHHERDRGRGGGVTTLGDSPRGRHAALHGPGEGRPGGSLPSGGITWSSDDSSLVSVGADGVAEGLQAGQTNIWATLEGVRGSATVTVEPGPTIEVTPAILSFRTSLGGSPPDPKVVQIINTGGGTLAALSASVEYLQGGATGWLSLSLAGTTAPTNLTVSALTGPLSAGIHTATIRVAAQGAKNSPLSIPVQVEVTLDQPIIALSPTTLEFEVERDGPSPAPKTVQVSNAGGGTLSGLEALAPGGWFSASLTGTTAPTQLLVEADPAGLAVGNYQGTIVVRSSLAGIANQSVGVTFRVVTPPSANLGVTKSGPPTAFVGDTVVFVLTVTNAGPDEARNVTGGLPPPGAGLREGFGRRNASGRVVTWNLGTRQTGATRVDSLWTRVESRNAHERGQGVLHFHRSPARKQQGDHRGGGIGDHRRPPGNEAGPPHSQLPGHDLLHPERTEQRSEPGRERRAPGFTPRGSELPLGHGWRHVGRDESGLDHRSPGGGGSGDGYRDRWLWSPQECSEM